MTGSKATVYKILGITFVCIAIWVLGCSRSVAQESVQEDLTGDTRQDSEEELKKDESNDESIFLKIFASERFTDALVNFGIIVAAIFVTVIGQRLNLHREVVQQRLLDFITNPRRKTRPDEEHNIILTLGIGGSGKSTFRNALLGNGKRVIRKTEKFKLYEPAASSTPGGARIVTCDYKGQDIGTFVKEFVKTQTSTDAHRFKFGHITNLLLIVDVVSDSDHLLGLPDPNPETLERMRSEARDEVSKIESEANATNNEGLRDLVEKKREAFKEDVEVTRLAKMIENYRNVSNFEKSQCYLSPSQPIRIISHKEAKQLERAKDKVEDFVEEGTGRRVLDANQKKDYDELSENGKLYFYLKRKGIDRTRVREHLEYWNAPMLDTIFAFTPVSASLNDHSKPGLRSVTLVVNKSNLLQAPNNNIFEKNHPDNPFRSLIQDIESRSVHPLTKAKIFNVEVVCVNLMDGIGNIRSTLNENYVTYS